VNRERIADVEMWMQQEIERGCRSDAGGFSACMAWADEQLES